MLICGNESSKLIESALLLNLQSLLLIVTQHQCWLFTENSETYPNQILNTNQNSTLTAALKFTKKTLNPISKTNTSMIINLLMNICNKQYLYSVINLI